MKKSMYLAIFSFLLFIPLQTYAITQEESENGAGKNENPYEYWSSRGWGWYEGYGLGYFDDSDQFHFYEDVDPKKSPDRYERFLHDVVPAIQYHESKKTTGYYEGLKFIEVIYPENKTGRTNNSFSPVIFEGKYGYLYYDGHMNEFKRDIHRFILLPEKDVSLDKAIKLEDEDISSSFGGLRPPSSEAVCGYDSTGQKVSVLLYLIYVDEPQYPGATLNTNTWREKTNAIAGFVNDLTPITVPDIKDPTLPVPNDTPNNVDPTTPASSLSLTQVPTLFYFGMNDVSGNDKLQAFYTKKQILSSGANEKEGVQVFDGRLIEKGWKVTAEFSGFDLNGTPSLEGATINLADNKAKLSLANASYSAQHFGFELGKNLGAKTILETTDAKNFTGNYWDEEDIVLEIPGEKLELGEHSGVVTWTLASSPII